MAGVRIPLFPLHVVLFPSAALPLHVFEQRYRTMMVDVLAAPEPAFGVVGIREGYEVGARAETHDVGCLAIVEHSERHADGTTDLLVRGSNRFRIEVRPDDDPYPQADVVVLDEPEGPRASEAMRLARAALERYAIVVAQTARHAPVPIALSDDPVAASYEAASALAVDLPLLQQLIEAASAAERLARVASIARAEASLLDVIGAPLRAGIRPASLN